ncbi:hypothetical protein KKC1_16090 [Calderihabitans maritimus]|uniref:Uncharacterized protein n=1 Tax=Calderihabitans maritimus TaxID=1246530 RepID=A0A1Z5HT22_9FIRM|nr:hypothetical protein KKC1_16090 [Calderihabitans maritimus]
MDQTAACCRRFNQHMRGLRLSRLPCGAGFELRFLGLTGNMLAIELWLAEA